MYVCGSCGEHFESPETEKKYTGVKSEGYSEYFEVGHCPYCGSEDIEDGHRCGVCGEWFYQKNCEEFCQDCFDKLAKELYAIQVTYGVDYETLKNWIGDYFEW